jgi:hypothetical protein
LHVHDAVKQVIAANLRATDPIRYREYRRRAWQQLRTELAAAPAGELWRYTADMLYLLENPTVRDAFFPAGASAYSVEPARPQDGPSILSVCQRHEGAEALTALSHWWSAAPHTFSVVRDPSGKVVGFYCLCESQTLPRELIDKDPVVRSWLADLRQNPPLKNEIVLLLRRWLTEVEGELPSAIQAACWLDIKRTYMTLRPNLRRVYLVLRDIAPLASVAQTLGFVPLPACDVMLDSHNYSTAMLDFGPASVDGWLTRLVAAELGLNPTQMLDVDARELVLEDRRIPLTRLEFSVFNYLREREGKAVAREALIHDVWGHKFDVGSNVVDAVIKSLRKKLGIKADLIETVAGHGYKLKTAA